MNYMTTNTNNNILQQTIKLRLLIKEIHNCCQDRMLFESNKFNLPQAELKCLMLFNGKRILTAKEITEELDVAKSRVTKIINGLMNKGFVKRDYDPKDGRIKLISITPTGEKKLKEVENFVIGVHKELYLQIKPEDREYMIQYLEMLTQCMDFIKKNLCEFSFDNQYNS